MPKQKTHSGAKKRFKITGTGKLMRRHGMKSHILEKKSPKRKWRMSRDQRSPRSTCRRSSVCSVAANPELAS